MRMPLFLTLALLFAVAGAFPVAATVEIEVASFNIAKGQGLPNAAKYVGDRYLKMIVPFVKRVSPDVVGMQEVGRNIAFTRFIDQDQWLAPRLGFKHYHWDQAKCTLGGLLLKQGNGNFARHPILERRTIRYETRGEGGGAASEPRIAVLSILNIEGYRVAFVTTHLGFPEEARVGQARELVEALAAVPEPVILTGDFNAPKGAPSYKIIADAFDDTWELAGLPPESTLGRGSKKIDHIFVTPGRFAVLKTYVEKAGEVSDHHMVVARLAMRTEGLAPAAAPPAEKPGALERLTNKLRNIPIFE